MFFHPVEIENTVKLCFSLTLVIAEPQYTIYTKSSFPDDFFIYLFLLQPFKA